MEGCLCTECSRTRAHTDLIRRRLRALERPSYFTSSDAEPATAADDHGPATTAGAPAHALHWWA